jgi:hypothetical protein
MHQDLKKLVGKRIEIRKGKIKHQGILMDKIGHYEADSKKRAKVWVLFDIDDSSNSNDVRFAEDDGWVATIVKRSEAAKR